MPENTLDTPPPESTGGGWLGRLIAFVIGAAVLGSGVYLSYYWLTHRPKARRRPPSAWRVSSRPSP